MTKMRFSIGTITLINIIAIIVMILLGLYGIIFPSEAAAVSATLVGILVELGFVAVYSITERLVKNSKQKSNKIVKILVSMLSLLLIMILTALAFDVARYSAGLMPVFGGYVGAWFIYLIEDEVIKAK